MGSLHSVQALTHGDVKMNPSQTPCLICSRTATCISAWTRKYTRSSLRPSQTKHQKDGNCLVACTLWKDCSLCVVSSKANAAVSPLAGHPLCGPAPTTLWKPSAAAHHWRGRRGRRGCGRGRRGCGRGRRSRGRRCGRGRRRRVADACAWRAELDARLPACLAAQTHARTGRVALAPGLQRAGLARDAPVCTGRLGAAATKAAGAPPLYLLGHWLCGGRTMYTCAAAPDSGCACAASKDLEA